MLAAAVLATGPVVPAADSPVRADGDALVFSSYDLRGDAYRLVLQRGRETTRLPVEPAAEPFDADVDGDTVVFARAGRVHELPSGADRGTGRLPSLSRGTLAVVVGDEVRVGGRVVARAPAVTEIALDGTRLAVASRRGVELVDLATRRLRTVTRRAGAIGLSFAGAHLGWYRRGAHRFDLASGTTERVPGPDDVSGFALLDGGRTVRVEPEGEEGRLRFGLPFRPAG
jgi:hypothetical protein